LCKGQAPIRDGGNGVARRLTQIQTDFLNLLVQLSTSIPGDVKRAETLIKRLQEKKQAAEWRWLMEKAEELKNPRLKNKLD
jgi:hypothetical protein